MHRRNHLFPWLIFLSLILLFTGCVNADIHVNIHKDGSGIYRAKVVTNEWILSNLTTVKNQLQEQGFQLQEVSSGSQKGWVAEKHVKSVMDEPPAKAFQALSGSSPAMSREPAGGIKIQHQLFTSKITYDDVIDFSDQLPQPGMEQWFFEQMYFRFHLTTPLQAEEHNATTMENDGKTLTWHINPAKPNPIHVTYVIPNPVTWGLILLIAAAGLIAGGIWLIRSRRRKKRTGDPAEPPVSFRWDTRK